jgi:hypothetical protein
MNSYRKGADAERQIAKLLKKLTGEDWARTGMPERGKLVAKGDVNPVKKIGLNKYINQDSWYYQNLQIDVKKRQNWDLISWFKKLNDETEPPKKPIIIVSRNNSEWFVFLKLEDFFKLIKK